MKRKVTKIILLAMLISFGLNTMAQVSINSDGSEADESAILEVKSTEKGVLITRMTETEIKDISNPANGLIVINTTDNRLYLYDDNAGEWKEIAIGTGTITPTPLWSCGDDFVDSRDSKTYTSVQIGTQCWMAENLNYSTSNSWWYNNSSTYGDVYGRLYLWDAAQSACPSGWHLPSGQRTDESEWNILIAFLGGNTANAGGKIKETGTTHWTDPNTGATNASGFTSLGGGKRYSTGTFGEILGHANYWTSSEVSTATSTAYVRDQGNYHGSIYDDIFNKTEGCSVRCIKD